MSKIRALRMFFYSVVFLASSVFAAPQCFAQTQGTDTQSPAAPRIYDTTKEVVLKGTISEVSGHPKAGLPLGLHLMVSTAQGEMDVHLGPYFGRIAAEKGLVGGAAIQVTGVNLRLAAGDVFLARVVVVGKQTLTIRNQNGIPVRPGPTGTGTTRGAQSSGGL